MASLNDQYGQPHQLAMQCIAELMDGPSVRSGYSRAFKRYALKICAPVGMLEQLGDEGQVELQCGSHVTRPLSKLPHDQRANLRRYVNPIQNPIPTLLDLAEWFEYEVRVQEDVTMNGGDGSRDRTKVHKYPRIDSRPPKSATILLGGDQTPIATEFSPHQTLKPLQEKQRKYCPYCDHNEHYLNQCANCKMLMKEQVTMWIRGNMRCWRCGCKHQAVQCTLKPTCKLCSKKHLDVLHEANAKEKIKESTEPPTPINETLYLDRPLGSTKVLLKISKVLLRHVNRTMETYAILDDGSEWTILLHDTAQKIGLEDLRGPHPANSETGHPHYSQCCCIIHSVTHLSAKEVFQNKASLHHQRARISHTHPTGRDATGTVSSSEEPATH